MHLAPSKPNLNEGSSPPHSAGRKLGRVEKSLLWTWLHENPQCPSRMILDNAAQAQVPMPVSVRHLNRLRARWGLNRRPGRPRQDHASLPVVSGQDRMPQPLHLSFVGVHLFALWLEHHHALDLVVRGLQQAIRVYQQAHSDEDFALAKADGEASYEETEEIREVATSLRLSHQEFIQVKVAVLG